MSFVKNHPLAVFIVLACAFSWWIVPLAGYPLGSGPFVAAVVVLLLTEGRPGVWALLRRMVQWRISWKWYALAIGLPTVAALIAATGTVALGAEPPTSAELATWTNIVPFFFFALIVPMLGPWEEPGFRGYALSRLRRTHSPLVAGLLVGVLAAGWHLPLFFTGDIPLADVVLVIAAGVVFAALVWGSGGSVLIAMVMHAASNAVSGEFISQMFLEDAAVEGWIRALVWCVYAVVTVGLCGRAFRTRPSSPTEGDATRVEVSR
jgi:membrane protease YdiL (CAAX protease family)